jgi:hypothetical protein
LSDGAFGEISSEQSVSDEFYWLAGFFNANLFRSLIDPNALSFIEWHSIAIRISYFISCKNAS